MKTQKEQAQSSFSFLKLFSGSGALAEKDAMIEGLHRSQAVIEFDMSGNILTANQNFLSTMGYQLDEIQGKHHSIFVDDEVRTSDEYRAFWDKLNRGEFQAAEFKRLGKNGKIVWIEASYNPLIDSQGKPYKVIKFATDITDKKIQSSDYQSQLNAISKSQAVIEFNMDGTIISANENFLNTVGYNLDEIKGRHHSIFVEKAYKQSHEYQAFWDRLNRGEFESAEFKRFGKNGKEIWIQASYNPILDLSGKPYKVVKFATDITEQKLLNTDYQGQINAISKSQAVIEFNMDGTIIRANENFLNAVDYSLDEIKGKHHSIFVDKTYAHSNEYKAFWEKLNRGEFESAEFKRFGKNGKEVWIQASYNPILDLNGNPVKVVKYASDITEQKNRDALLQKEIKENETKIQGILTDLQERIALYSEYIAKIAKGDLRETLLVEGDDDLSKLANHINEMTKGLKKIASQIVASSSDIGVGINELENTANTQASAATEQATSVTEISSIVEEIKTTSKQTLEKAGNLGDTADKTSKEGEKGKEAIKKMSTSMNGLQNKIEDVAKTILNLSDKTQQIGEITEAVADIAKQSKMLALNASIEAAKAGESGKGFAVVASEVKELADKSQVSTERVQKILQDIRQTADKAVMVTEDGTKSVEDNLNQVVLCGDIMDALGEVIENSSIASQQIVSAIKEESAGIDQVVLSMREIDKSTAQFSRSTEETKNAVVNLSKVSETLKDSASIYKTESDD